MNYDVEHSLLLTYYLSLFTPYLLLAFLKVQNSDWE